MAKPYFTGDYGHLARVDTRPIIEAGRAQGQMYANMGAQIGGMIKEYGLNKEKRRKEEDTAMGTLAGFTPEELMQIGQDNPKLGKAIERATTEGATPRDFQIINASAAPIVAGKARRMAEAAQKTQNDMQKFNLELARKLEGTTIQRQEDERRHKATITRLLEMDEEDRIALGSLPVDQQIQALQGRMEEEEAFSGKERGALKKESAEQTVDAGKLGLEQKQREAIAAMAEPEFASMEQVKTWEANLPPGVEANVEKHKDGWNAISLKVTSKDRVKDIPSVPGYPNYKIVGGYVYEGDPDKETLTKLGAEQPGRETELLIKVIGAMSTPDVEQYRKAKLRGTPSDDGKFFEFDDPISGVEYRIPFNKDLEEKIAEIKRFEDQMKSSMPNTVDFRTR